MRIIFHIGMGKTGTTSIQNALSAAGAQLAEQRTAYLGMWFDMIDPAFFGLEGSQQFFDLGDTALRAHAERFAGICEERARRDGTELFLFSNEAIFEAGPALTPFFEALDRHMDVRFLAYMRDPHRWLPSAYTQWGIRHKHNKGAVRTFPETARELIGMYDATRHWVAAFGDRLTVRPQDTGTDVVADFATACGMDVDLPERRSLERSEPAELILRAIYNDRFEDRMLPQQFNNFVVNPQRGIRSVSEMRERCFAHEGIAEIVSERRELFEFIRDNLGLDFLEDTTEHRGLPDETELRARLIDYLIEIAFSQAHRIKRLEREVEKLAKAQ